jgi:hypothetical protein
MTGVEAERDGGALEDAKHLVPALHDRPDVRVQGRPHAAFRGSLGQPVQVRQQCPPGGGVQLRPLVVPAQAGRCRQDERAGARLDEGVQLPVHHSPRVGRRVVQDHGHEPADRVQAVSPKDVCPFGAVGGQEPFRAELRGLQPDGAHLVQHPLGGQLHSPARDLAHPPRNRRTGNPFDERAHANLTSSTATRRLSRSDRSAASAT